MIKFNKVISITQEQYEDFRFHFYMTEKIYPNSPEELVLWLKVTILPELKEYDYVRVVMGKNELVKEMIIEIKDIKQMMLELTDDELKKLDELIDDN